MLASAIFIHSWADSSDVRRFLLLRLRPLRLLRLLRTQPLGMALGIAAMSGLAAGCASGPPASESPVIGAAQAHEMIDRSLPHTVPDRAGWVRDLYAAFSALGIEPTHENVCAIVAVTEQESGFRVDPVIPGLPAIAWREIDSRAERAGVPRLIVHTALQLKSPNGRSYSDRIDSGPAFTLRRSARLAFRGRTAHWLFL